MTNLKIPPAELYQQDYYAWIQDQLRTLRVRRVEELFSAAYETARIKELSSIMLDEQAVPAEPYGQFNRY